MGSGGRAEGRRQPHPNRGRAAGVQVPRTRPRGVSKTPGEDSLLRIGGRSGRHGRHRCPGPRQPILGALRSRSRSQGCGRGTPCAPRSEEAARAPDPTCTGSTRPWEEDCPAQLARAAPTAQGSSVTGGSTSPAAPESNRWPADWRDARCDFPGRVLTR